MNRNYVNGRRCEYTIVNSLKQQGFSCARMAGSHSAFDVIAYGHQQIRFIQSKKEGKEATGNWETKYAEDIKQMQDAGVPESSGNIKITKELWIFRSRKPVEVHLIN